MTTIYEITKAALDTLAPVQNAMDVFLGTLPNTYLVYTLVSGVSEQHGDDLEIHRTARIQVSIYSRDGLVSVPNVDAAMLAAGFTKGPERNLPYSLDTNHFGVAKDYFYLLTS